MPTEDELMAQEEAMAAMDDDALKQFMEGDASPPAAAPAPAAMVEQGSEAEPAAASAETVQPAELAAAEPAQQTLEPVAAADEEDPEPAPLPQRTAPDDAADQRKVLRAEKSDAMQQLLAGEITPEEFQTVEDGVQDKLDALVRAESSDHAREQMRMDLMRDDYDKDLRTAQKELSTAGLDFKAKDGAIAAEFDRAVRMFAGEAGARGLSDRPGELAASREALAEAKALMLRRYGKATPAPALAAAPAAPKRDMSPPDRSKLPPTLANAPAARADVGEENRFAHIDAITDPIQREAAMARLSEADQERYMQG